MFAEQKELEASLDRVFKHALTWRRRAETAEPLCDRLAEALGDLFAHEQRLMRDGRDLQWTPVDEKRIRNSLAAYEAALKSNSPVSSEGSSGVG